MASPTAAVMQGRRVFSAACRHGWPHLMGIITKRPRRTKTTWGSPQADTLGLLWHSLQQWLTRGAKEVKISTSTLSWSRAPSLIQNWLFHWSCRKVTEMLVSTVESLSTSNPHHKECIKMQFTLLCICSAGWVLWAWCRRAAVVGSSLYELTGADWTRCQIRI